ncbi:MAG: hypothetical protein HN403_00540 [Rhodospirillales bacterium]|jgi:hypothetical protein|nr:hypothetical protein [Rhodospirillales bacterium]
MRRLLLLFGLLGFVATHAATLASAQGLGEGLFNSVAYKPIPAGAAVKVRPMDNSSNNLVLQEEFERELAAQGYAVGDDAQYVLSFETSDVVGAYTDRDQRHVVELSGSGGRSGGEDLRARVNVFDSAAGGLFNAGRGTGDTSIVTPTQYRMDATIDDKGTGRRLWQAWAVANLEQSDGLTLTLSMVPVVAEAVGQTVKQKPFSLR